MKNKKFFLPALIALAFVSCSTSKEWKTGVSFYGFTLGEYYADSYAALQNMAKLGQISNILVPGMSFVDTRVMYYPLPIDPALMGIQTGGLEFVGSVAHHKSYLVEADFTFDKTPASMEKITALLGGFTHLSNAVQTYELYTESNSYYVFTNQSLAIEAKHTMMSNSQRLVIVYWGCILYIQEHEQ
ncbi:MAG: hypothetical protein A2014_06040 [Spirochaetes bacterium GWF1_49_6]|nr:MAG: hypothetical protein A2014_06040 [Spirochaetes bacterium GWF1_49_6]